MENSCGYENESEQGQHFKAMHRLAEDLHLPEEDVKIVYEEVLCKIKDGAKVKDFLVILVSRNVKDLIKRGFTAGS